MNKEKMNDEYNWESSIYFDVDNSITSSKRLVSWMKEVDIYKERIQNRYKILEVLDIDSNGMFFKVEDTFDEKIKLMRISDAKIITSKIDFYGCDQDNEESLVEDNLSNYILTPFTKSFTIIQLPNDLNSYRLDYCIYPFITGISLEGFIRQSRGEIILDRIILILYYVAKALDFLHKENVIYQYLNPKNILVADKAYLLDRNFLIKDDISDEKNEALYSHNYFSLEQFDNKSSIKSDIWALGCILYELIGKKKAFGALDIDRLKVSIQQKNFSIR